MREFVFTCVQHACAGRVHALRHTAMDQTGLLLLCAVFPFKSMRLAHVESLSLVAISSACLGRLSSELGVCSVGVHSINPHRRPTLTYLSVQYPIFYQIWE